MGAREKSESEHHAALGIGVYNFNAGAVDRTHHVVGLEGPRPCPGAIHVMPSCLTDVKSVIMSHTHTCTHAHVHTRMRKHTPALFHTHVRAHTQGHMRTHPHSLSHAVSHTHSSRATNMHNAPIELSAIASQHSTGRGNSRRVSARSVASAAADPDMSGGTRVSGVGCPIPGQGVGCGV